MVQNSHKSMITLKIYVVTRFRYVFKASKHSEKHQNQSQITKINYLKKIKVLSKHQKNLKKHDEALGDIKKY